MAMKPISIKEQIEATVRSEIERAREEVCKEAEAVFQQRVREIVSKVATNVADYYSMESIGTVLHVRIQKGVPDGPSR